MGVAVELAAGGSVVARARTDEQGHFGMSAAPGRYTVVVRDPYRRAPTTGTVHLSADETTTVRLELDTGIRGPATSG